MEGDGHDEESAEERKLHKKANDDDCSAGIESFQSAG